MGYRIMRMMLFFDLPSVTKVDKREYRNFVKFIKEHGFIRLQESVYVKLATNQTVVDSHIKLIKANLPKAGLIAVLTITEKQFNGIDFLSGNFSTDIIESDSKYIEL